jgi:hypothetical protein
VPPPLPPLASLGNVSGVVSIALAVAYASWGASAHSAAVQSALSDALRLPAPAVQVQTSFPARRGGTVLQLSIASTAVVSVASLFTGGAVSGSPAGELLQALLRQYGLPCGGGVCAYYGDQP